MYETDSDTTKFTLRSLPESVSVEPSFETHGELHKEFEQTIRWCAGNTGCPLFEVLDLLMERR
jgi:hypothetical protein